ncbi:MAG: DnaA/Hda family protein [Pirellulales bacterium]
MTGYCNRLAHASVMQVVDHPGEPNPLLIHGGTGTGKTHLLEGLIHANRTRHPSRNCLFLTAEQFTSQFLEALHGRGLPMFRRKYRSVDFLVVDDVQFLAGKRATLTEFVHTLDTLLRDHKQVVLSSDRPPHELHELGQHLGTAPQRRHVGATRYARPPGPRRHHPPIGGSQESGPGRRNRRIVGHAFERTRPRVGRRDPTSGARPAGCWDMR